MRCRICRRPALFRARGAKGNKRLHGDKQHDLCQRCNRDLLNRVRHPRVREQRVGPFPPLASLLAAKEDA